MNKRIKKKKQALWLRSATYWYVRDCYQSGYCFVIVNDMMRRNGNLWLISEKDMKQAVRWLRSDWFQFQFSEFIPRGLGVPGWSFWFYEN